jgi:CheY-like chemotaxis protein
MNKLKILIVEDDEISRDLLRIQVRMYGKEILQASTGVEAIEICRLNRDIDLVLMDIQLPEMDGFEATHLIREFDKNVVIIAQTAFGYNGEMENAIAAGCTDYIAKPIMKAQLMELIQKYFRK